MSSEYSYDYDYDEVEIDGNRRRGCLAFLIVFLIIAVVVVGAYFWWSNFIVDDGPNKQVVIEDVEEDHEDDDHDHDDDHHHDAEVYRGNGYVVEVPEGWQVVKPSPAFRVLSIMNESNRIEIFKLSDFDGNREFNFTGRETEEEIDSNVPKEFLTIGTGVNQYNVWLFYLTDDEEGKEALHDIYDSIEVESVGELG